MPFLGIVGAIVTLVTLAALGALLFVFVGAFKEADPSVQSAIIAALVAIISLTLTVWRERSRTIREAHRDQKIAVYSEFYDIIFFMLQKAKSGKEQEEYLASQEFHEKMFRLMQGILFYGSPDVVQAFSSWKISAAEAPDKIGSAPDALASVGKILLAMRKDIGLSNWGLDAISVHQIYVTDDLAKLGIRR